MQRARGFTLIELLVAVAIMAVLAVTGWRALDGMQQTNQLARSHTDTVLRLEAGLSQWGADLDAMQASNGITPLEWDGGVLRITRRHATDAALGLVVVAWTRGLRGNSQAWLRWQSEPVRTVAAWQAAWQAAQLWAQNPSEQARAREVTLAPLAQWQVFYFQGSNLVAATTSAQAAQAAAPDGVRLVLTIDAPHPLAGTITRDWVRATLAPNAP